MIAPTQSIQGNFPSNLSILKHFSFVNREKNSENLESHFKLPSYIAGLKGKRFRILHILFIFINLCN